MVKNEVGDHSFFVVRAATHSLSDLINRLDQIQANQSQDYLPLITDWLKEPWNQKGLFLASPDLYEAWLSQAHQQQLSSPTLKALWRYILRSYSRATPFGLFAGAGLGRVDKQNAFTLGSHPWRVVSRPDATLLTSASEIILQEPFVRKQLLYSLNNSLYQVGEEFRFSQSVPESTGFRIILTSYAVTAELSLIVEKLTQETYLSFQSLLALFDLEDQQEAEVFVNQLIDSQFLSNSLMMPVTGPSWISRLTHLDQTKQVVSPLLRELVTISNDLMSQDQTLEGLEATQKKLKKINGHPQSSPAEYAGSMIQTDLVFTPDQLSLNQQLVHQLAEQFSQILPLIQNKREFPIANFIRKFRERYQDATVDLLTALDPEYGLGFHVQSEASTSLLKQIPFASPANEASETPSNLVKLIYERFSLTGHMEISLTEEDIIPLLEDQPKRPLPPSFYLFGELYQQPPVAKESVEDLVNPLPTSHWHFSINAGTTSSPTFLLGRFCLNDPLLTRQVQEMCAWEQSQYPNEILAEVVHAPPSPNRARNVVSRPVLRSYEIPYLTPAGVAADRVINLNDLGVYVTHTEQIYLINKSTGQRIRPRLSTAHKFTLGDDIYQFLGYIEQLETNRYGVRWGYFKDQPVLPRITYKNLILQPARWTIRRSTVQQNGPVTLQHIRRLYNLPKYLQLIERDLPLFLDLDAAPCQTILLDELNKNELIRLTEWLPASYQPWLVEKDRYFVSELIIPLKGLSTTPGNPTQRVVFDQTTQEARTVYPGGPWLYYKIYLSELAADYFLTHCLFDFTNQLLSSGLCQQFFFIRFADPDFHIRIRFQSDTSVISKLIEACNSFFTPSTPDSLVYRFSIETYQREIERYTPELMAACETVFSQDSLMILTYLSSQENSSKSDIERYAFAIGQVSNLVDDFRYSLEAKIAFCQRNQTSYWHEEGSLKSVKKGLNSLFRQYADSIFDQAQQLTDDFLHRSQAFQAALDQINLFYQQKPQTVVKDELLTSLIHMHINRLFPTEQRRHELVIYHFLVRRYESLLARLKTDTASPH
ncbi:lantibiotic dehydratase [Spirosoma horti]